MKKLTLGIFSLLFGIVTARAQQQSVTTSNFSWGGGTMTIVASVVVGQATGSFTGGTAATAALYTSTGTLVATHTSSSGTAAGAAADGIAGDVLDSTVFNFGTVSAGTYKITYTGTKSQRSPDFNQYYYAYWSTTPTPSTPTTFSLSATSFTYNGSAQGPTVVASPSGATFTTGGTLSATNVGTYVATATATGSYGGSNTNLGWSIVKGPQSTVSITPSSQTVNIGSTITFTASGGSGTGAYVWGNEASGNGTSKTLTFNTTGTHTITVYHQGDSNYNDSNTATATITVTLIATTFALNTTSFVYNGTAQGPAVVATPSGATFSTGGTLSATNAGAYTATAAATGNYSGSNNSLTWSITKAGQPTPTLSPTSQTITAGSSITFGVSGGAGTGAYLWSGSASGSGTSQMVTFSNVGTYTVTVYRQGDGNYNDSASTSATITVNPVATTFALSATAFTYNGATQGPSIVPTPGGATFTPGGTLSATNAGSYTATATATGNYSGSNNALTWTINKANQPTLTISPTSPTTTFGGSITFTTAGSAGTGAYVWGGDASGSGSSATVTFNTVGTRTVTVYRQGDGNYNTSNTATATVTVSGANTTFSINGPFTYDGTAKTVTITPNPSNATFTTGGTLTATNPGTYVATATATGNYAGSNNNLAWTINKANQATVYVSPTSQSLPQGRTLTFTAVGGSGSGNYIWSGDASGTGTTAAVTFNTVGTRTVTVYRQGDSLYNDSSPVTVTITVLSPQQDSTNQTVKLKVHIPN